MNNPATLRTMLRTGPKAIAVVGLSDNPRKPSHYVSAYMQHAGHKLYPINPAIPSVLGEPTHPTLTALVHSGLRPDIVNVFRLPTFLPAIVEEMIALRLPNLWVQQGIVHQEAAARAEAAGIHVVMDRCIMVEHRRLQS